MNPIENTTSEEADWDRSEYGPCDPHYFEVDDLGQFKCTDCRARYKDEVVIEALKDLHGELWNERWEVLKRTRKLVNSRKWDRLDVVYSIYRDNNGAMKTILYFFHEKLI
jgi:DnaJ-domain-containing protein 1